MSRSFVLRVVLVGLLVWFGSSRQALAVTCTHYVDPDWGGTASGTASQPWTSLTSSAWTTINTALASGAVYVCFSARAAGSDINQTTTTELLVLRTDTSTNLLTLDGMSQYNTNDGAPSWTDYPARTQTVTLSTGTVVTGRFYNGSRFTITASIPISTDTGQVVRSYVTIKGFHGIATGGIIVFYWDGDHVTVEDVEGEGNTSQGNGPGFYFTGTREEGQSGTCTPSGAWNCRGKGDLIVRRNYVHDQRGEGMYFAGCADSTSCPTKTNNFLIEDNVLANVSRYDGEGDGIDIKTNLVGVTVRGNWIEWDPALTYEGVAGGSGPRAGIETLSGVVFENNYINGNSINCLGISLTDFWSNYGTTRAGTVVRNNVFIRIGGAPPTTCGTGDAIRCYGDTAGTDDFTGLLIHNNTIATTNQYGIALGVLCTTATVQNNVVSGTVDLAGTFSTGILLTHDHNDWNKPSGTAVVYGGSSYTAAQITSFEATSISADPVFVSTGSPYTALNFALQTSSPAKNAGTTIGSFSTDYSGVSRPQGAAWDMGAFEFVEGGVSPVYRLRLKPGQ